MSSIWPTGLIYYDPGMVCVVVLLLLLLIDAHGDIIVHKSVVFFVNSDIFIKISFTDRRCVLL